MFCSSTSMLIVKVILGSVEVMTHGHGLPPYNPEHNVPLHVLTVPISITATLHDKNYARLSIMLQYHCQTSLLFTVPPEAFYPKPKVQSSVIRMTPYQTPPIICNNYPLLEKLVATAFNQRRKTIQNSLKDYLVIADFIQLNLDPTLRAENCSLEDFINIVKLLSYQ